jgi:peroxiredoxin
VEGRHHRPVFKGRTVSCSRLPGAYTPTCSSTHLPRYNELAPTFRKLGVDEIVCLSVNDAFVMSEWQKDQNAPNVTFIPDGNGAFTEAWGCWWTSRTWDSASARGAIRCWSRTAWVEKMFIEPQKEGDRSKSPTPTRC